jgi:hypothetical protein
MKIHYALAAFFAIIAVVEIAGAGVRRLRGRRPR